MSGRAHLHLLCGKAGAGKSTLAKMLADRHRAILISEDVWLFRLFGDQMQTFEDYRRFSQRGKTVVGPLVVDLLKAGLNVVLDFPANTRATREWCRSLAVAADAESTLHVVAASDAVCLERIEKRNAERPEGSHHITPEVFAHVSSFFEPPEAAEGLSIEMHAQSPFGSA